MRIERAVRPSADFIDEAMELFPEGGSPDGRPPFELFRRTVYAAAETAFGMSYERQLEARLLQTTMEQLHDAAATRETVA